jgi:hypothetical protein
MAEIPCAHQVTLVSNYKLRKEPKQVQTLGHVAINNAAIVFIFYWLTSKWTRDPMAASTERKQIEAQSAISNKTR